MTTLQRFSEDKLGCWARIDFDNGDPVWISVSSRGVVVKRSRFGVMGYVMFEERRPVVLLDIVDQLEDDTDPDVTVPGDITNRLLKQFTKAAISSSSIHEYSAQLMRMRRRALNESDPTDLAMPDELRQQIIMDYAAYLEDHSPLGELFDDSVLPRPKHDILDAILIQIVIEPDRLRVQALKDAAILLAEFQEGVGEHSLSALGMDCVELASKSMGSTDEITDLVLEISCNPDRERYEQVREVADVEREEIGTKVIAALALRHEQQEVA